MGERTEKLRAQLEMAEAEEAFLELKAKREAGKVKDDAWVAAKEDLRAKRAAFRQIREDEAAAAGTARPGTVEATASA